MERANSDTQVGRNQLTNAAARLNGEAASRLPPSPTNDVHPLARRAWQRVVTKHPVVLGGPAGDFSAQVVDLSRGGALVAAADPLLTADTPDVERRVRELFPEGLDIRFVEVGIARRSHVARVVVSPGATLGLGCSFDQELTTREALVLGVVAGETHVPEVRLEALPFEPRSGHPLTLVLADQVAGLAGPIALGPVTGTGEYSVDAHLPQDRETLIAGCGDGPLGAALVVGTERLWEGLATLVVCETVPDVGSRVRVLFEHSFDHRLASRLQRRGA